MSPLTSPDAHVVLRTASALSGAHPKGAMIPEALLLALLHAPSIGGEGNGVVPEEDALRRAVLSSDESPGADGWSPRAQEVYRRAWARARERGRARSLLGGRFALGPSRWGVSLVPDASLTLGDLLAGLAGTRGLVDSALRARALDPSAFDDEAGAPLPDALPLGELPREGRVALVALNDDKTPMDFVIHVLETFVGVSQLRALSLMYAVDERGRARIWSGPASEAASLGERIVGAAREAGFPLALGWEKRG